MRLEAIDLAFGYPRRPVGHGANLAVEAGQVVCLLGPNGCGKTTFFKTLLGLLAAQAGRVVAGGHDLAELPRADIARRLAYVPQAQGWSFPYSALQLVLMGRTAHRGAFASPTADDYRIAENSLDRLGISRLADREVTRLSGGQRQLVVIARAIAQQAPIMIMDEPTASLDFGNQAKVLGEIRRLADSGSGIVLSTHDPDQTFAIADHVALMRDGQIFTQGEPAACLTAASLESVYGVPVAVERLASGQSVCVPRLERK